MNEKVTLKERGFKPIFLVTQKSSHNVMGRFKILACCSVAGASGAHRERSERVLVDECPRHFKQKAHRGVWGAVCSPKYL